MVISPNSLASHTVSHLAENGNGGLARGESDGKTETRKKGETEHDLQLAGRKLARFLVAPAAPRHDQDPRRHGADREPLRDARARALRHGEYHGERRVGAGDRGHNRDWAKSQSREER